jgi:hypothetical protein
MQLTVEKTVLVDLFFFLSTGSRAQGDEQWETPRPSLVIVPPTSGDFGDVTASWCPVCLSPPAET